ncbi:M50 family metallopeptidase (plasmid) [Saccharothrix sp. AJ9571]|nr:M50 family metallopeptidase [Saccharothrix sp. AJ9571]
MNLEELAGLVKLTSPAPGWWLVIATGLFALAVSASSFVLIATGTRWTLMRVNVIGTLAHEIGHAATSILTGGGVYRIAITGEDSGYTHHWVTSRWSSKLSLIAGYATPALAGLGAAALLDRGKASAILAITGTLMVLVLIVTRDLITLASVLAVGALTITALLWAPHWFLNLLAYTETWLLLTSEIGGIANLIMNRLRGHDASDDAAALHEETGIPAPLWILGWLVLIGWATWQGAILLWP